MSGLNKVMIIGHLGRDPELKYTQSGTAVCQLAVATSEKYKDKTGEMVEKTEWHRCVAFNKPAEVLGQYLLKGSQIYLEGKIQTRTYEKDGQTHYVTEIVVNQFTFLGGGLQRPQEQKPRAQAPQTTYPNDDDIPF